MIRRSASMKTKNNLWSLPLTVIFTLIISLFLVVRTHAASSYMESLNAIRWDLEPNKTVTYQTCYPGIGMRNEKAKMSNYQKTSLGSGYDRITFSLVMDGIDSLNDSEISAVVGALKGRRFGTRVFAIVDYDTGKTLEAPNAYGVTVTYKKEVLKTKRFNAANGDWVTIDTTKYDVQIDYPSSYEGMCIGASGVRQALYAEGKKDPYFEGAGRYGDTVFYDSSNHNLAHFMKVTSRTVIQKTPTSVKAKAKKNKVTVSWKKIRKTKKTKALRAQIKSIEVQYSTDPTFAQNTVSKTVGKNKTKVTLKLKKKTKYYFRVRYVGAGLCLPGVKSRE